jgi:uncharacterized cofD-like protein
MSLDAGGHGPKVVAIGGGHGLAQSLKAARQYAGELTAVVSVADDGGSSGRLRELLGIPAPGDVRRCMGALLAQPSLLADALEYRFSEGALKGHAFGNLLIAAMSSAKGDFVSGVEHTAQLLGILGRVLPATQVPVVLEAESATGELVGQVKVSKGRQIARVSIVPKDAPAPQAAIEAIIEADQVVLGPGSLFTSVLAACVVPDIRQALSATHACRVYVANLREQQPETAGLDVAGLLDALRAHGVPVDVVVADSVGLAVGELAEGVSLVRADLAAPGFAEHDPKLLAAELAPLVGRVCSVLAR